jgi:hypothetical protein
MKFSGNPHNYRCYTWNYWWPAQAPVRNNIWSSLWFRTAIFPSPFHNIIVPTFLSTGDDMTVPSSLILSTRSHCNTCKWPFNAAHMHVSALSPYQPWSQAHSSALICPPCAAKLTTFLSRWGGLCCHPSFFRTSRILHCPFYAASQKSSRSSISFHQFSA